MTAPSWIDPFAEADTPPPRSLGAFLRWALRGSFGVIGIAGATSAFAGETAATAVGAALSDQNL